MERPVHAPPLSLGERGQWLVAFAHMRKFAFKLEAVRRIRRQQEQLVQVELAAALRDRTDVITQLDASRQAELQLYEYLRTSKLSGDQMLHVSRYDALHRQRIVDLTIQLHNRDQAVARTRQRLVEARAHREALDKLEQRQRDQHRHEWLAAEVRELDEVGAQRRDAFGAALFASATRFGSEAA